MILNEEIVRKYLNHFFSRIVGFNFWRDTCAKQKVTEMATVSDEAFAYFLTEKTKKKSEGIHG